MTRKFSTLFFVPSNNKNDFVLSLSLVSGRPLFRYCDAPTHLHDTFYIVSYHSTQMVTFTGYITVSYTKRVSVGASLYMYEDIKHKHHYFTKIFNNDILTDIYSIYYKQLNELHN